MALTGTWTAKRRMQRLLPEAEFGPMIEYREHSFLENKRLTAAVKDSRVRVALCKPEEASAACSDGTAPAVETAGVVHIRQGLNDAQLKIALQVRAAGGAAALDAAKDE